MSVGSDSLAVISLFSGAGGLDLGFERAGFETVAAFDISGSAVKTYNSNREYPIARVADVGSLHAQTIAQVVVENAGGITPIGIIGGPPCQAFSRSNVYPREDDIRRTLPGQYARLLRELSHVYPLQFFVFENVQGITFERHKEEFAKFRFLFEEAGFSLSETLLNARHYGVPQDRPRVFIVGINSRLLQPHELQYEFPSFHFDEITVKQAFERAFGPKPWPEPAFFRRDLTTSEIPFHPNHWTTMPKSDKFTDGRLKEGEIKGRSFRVLSWNKPSWTVAYGHREIHVHPSGRRRLSIFEAMILQGFPKNYVLYGTLSSQITQVSDAVPPPLAFHIARSIMSLLESTSIHHARSA